jgi:hypothetical protein
VEWTWSGGEASSDIALIVLPAKAMHGRGGMSIGCWNDALDAAPTGIQPQARLQFGLDLLIFTQGVCIPI